MISQRTFAERLANEHGLEYGRSVPMPVGTTLGNFDEMKAPGDRPFRELVGSLMWLWTQTSPDYAVRAVARRCAAPKFIHWRAALGILGYLRRTSPFGFTFQRGLMAGLSMQVFADAYASKAANRMSV